MLALSAMNIGASAAIIDESRIADTPQDAATKSFGGRAIRTNEAGRYAIVLVRSGRDEGSTDDLLILTEHFRFGWQSIVDVYDACALRMFVASDRARAALLAGMPMLHRERGPCDSTGSGVDHGAASDIEAIRLALQAERFVVHVDVAGDYALAERDSGESLYQRRHGRWIAIAGGGGILSAYDLATYGVPKPVICRLAPSADTCPKPR